MQKYPVGFTFIELTISIFILSVALIGYLQVDLNSQQLLQQATTQQLLQHYRQQFYELVQNNTSQSNCNACVALNHNHITLLNWQTALKQSLPNLYIHYTIAGKHSIKLTFCKSYKPCQDFIIQV